jgi:dephospho-CoA kinase
MKKEIKNNRKKSPNRIKCQITGQERMSNKDYIAKKAQKAGITSAVWCSFYVSKDAYRELKEVVEQVGLEVAAEKYQVERETIKKWMRFNGRGRYNLPELAAVELAA